MTVLVTGASGFVGRHVISELHRRSIKVRVICRQGSEIIPLFEKIESVNLTGSGATASDWAEAVADCSAVIHLAARAHILTERNVDPEQAFQFANVDFARSCATAAARAGVQRFIFMSTVGVHGITSCSKPIHSGSAIKPYSHYTRSKAEAEKALTEVVSVSDMTLTVLRLPLVYGNGAPGNFRILVKSLMSNFPLPLGAITSNRRSFVAIDNLVDLIVTCLNHPAAANQCFMVSDGEDISTTDFVRRLGSMMGKPQRLLPVPMFLIKYSLLLLGRREMFQSLCGSLQVDISNTCKLLDWKPPVSLNEALRRVAQQGV